MSGCGGGCGHGCGCAPGVDTGGLPNLMVLDVMYGLLDQAMRNMRLRAAQCESGLMSTDEYDAAKTKLTTWLIALFEGRNPHYYVDREWHQMGGLTAYLRERLDRPFLSDKAVLEEAVALFVREADETAKAAVAEGSSEKMQEAASDIALLWAYLFTGTPYSFEDSEK